MRRYPGITPFKPEDAPVFKGRRTETREVTNLVLTQKTLILFAKSGMGKTSLLNAGVLPALKQYGMYPVFIRFNDMGSGQIDDPVARFMAQFEQVYTEFGESRARVNPFSPQGTIWEVLCQNQFVTRRDVLIPTLIFDQFEEFFRTYPQREKRNEFLKQLAELLSDAIPHQNPLPSQLATTGGEIKPLNLRVVFSIRSDMLNLMHEVSEYLPFVLRTRYELLPMTSLQATEAIREPGLVADGPYETGPITFPNRCVEDILKGVQDTYSNEIESFQLQLVCSHLEDQYIQAGKGTASSQAYMVKQEDYGGIPGIQTINEAYFSDTINAITEQPRQVVMKELITLLNDNDNRILKEDSQFDLLKSVKDKLEERRILKRDKIQANTYYEISHDKIALALQKEKVRIEEEQRIEQERVEAAKRAEQERIKAEQRLADEKAKRRKYATWFGVIGLIALIASIVAIIFLNQNKELEATKTSLTTTVSSLTITRDSLKTTVDSLRTTQNSLTATVASLESTTATLEKSNQKLVASINDLNQAKLKKAWADFDNAKKLMSGKLFEEALQTLPVVPYIQKKNKKIIPKAYQNMERLVVEAQRICNNLKEVKRLVSDAECLELKLRITCAHMKYDSAYKKQKQYVNKYKFYAYPSLEDKIKATEEVIAIGIYSGLKIENTAAYKIEIMNINNAVNCVCTK